MWTSSKAPFSQHSGAYNISTTAPLGTSMGARAIDQSVIPPPSSRRLSRSFTHTSGWQWLSRTPPSTLPNPTSHRIGSRTVAGRSTCGQWRASRAASAQRISSLYNLASRGLWVLASYGGDWRYSHGELEPLYALDSDRAELAAHDRVCCLARPAHPGAGRQRTWDLGWRGGAVAGHRGAARGGAGLRGAALRGAERLAGS